VIDSPQALAERFKEFQKLTVVVLEHRKNGRRINRHDYYEFIKPGQRRLSREQISIIAADIGVPAHVAEADYLERGGELKKPKGDR
jgi:hypothetical protein